MSKAIAKVIPLTIIYLPLSSYSIAIVGNQMEQGRLYSFVFFALDIKNKSNHDALMIIAISKKVQFKNRLLLKR